MKKILMIGDAGARTGFARVLKGIADRLHASGRWEVVVRAVNYNENHGIDYAYEVEPITHGGVDPTGASSLPFHVEDVKPDVLWCLQDPWHLQAYAVEKPKDIPAVAYVPVDTPCIKWENGLAMGAWSQVVSYTQFGARELTAAVQDGFDVFAENIKDRVDPTAPAGWVGVPIGNRRSLHVRLDRLARLQNLDAWNIIPHGREPNMFGPRDKMECRQQFGLPDGFLIGVVGGNQVRKRLDTAIRIFAEFARTHPDAYLVLHCWGGDDAGWDIAALARFYGVVDRIFPVHWQHSELSDDQLCSLYNCFDVMLNTSSGEGWGLTATESAECGVLQMVPDWAATGEIWRDNGALLIPPLDYLHFEKYLNTAHCVLNIPAAVALLNQCYADPNMRARQIELSQKRVADIPTWDAVADAFEIILNRAIDEGPPVPTSVNDVLASRKKTVRSQILDPIPV